jgi:imidazolonepropionase
MGFVMSLACIKMNMTPQEALNAATLNGAAAMELSHNTGSITAGKRADLIITRPMDALALVPYDFAGSHIAEVIIGGERLG